MYKPQQPKLFWANVAIFAFICVYSLMYPLMNDDLSRANIHALLSHTILSQLHQDYFNITGRLAAQLLVYIFFNSPSFNAISMLLLALITATAFLFLLRQLYSLIFLEPPSDQKINLYMLLVILLIYYLVKVYSFTELIGFKTSSPQYLWPIVFSGVILWRYCPVGHLLPHFTRASALQLTGFLFLGVFLGNFNEILTATVLLYLAIKFLGIYPKQIIQKCKSNLRMLSFGLGNFIGFIVLILSPGSYARQTYTLTREHLLNVHYSVFEKIHILISKYAEQIHFRVDCNVVALGLLILAVLFMLCSKKSAAKVRAFYHFLKLIGFLGLSLCILIPIAPYYELILGRITFIPDLILFCIIVGLLIFNLRCLPKLHRGLHWAYSKFPWMVMLGILCLYFVLFLYGCYPQYHYNQELIKTIQNTPNAETVDFVFPGFCPQNQFPLGKWQIANPLKTDPNFWGNRAFAQYYGARSVRELPCPMK